MALPNQIPPKLEVKNPFLKEDPAPPFWVKYQFRPSFLKWALNKCNLPTPFNPPLEGKEFFRKGTQINPFWAQLTQPKFA